MKFKLAHIVLIIMIIVVLGCIYLSYISPLTSVLRNNKPVNILVIGTDWVDYAQHADTVILFSYNPQSQLVDIFSLPRDTYVSLPDLPVHKIGEIYAYFYLHEKDHSRACAGFAKVIRGLLHNRVALNHYIQIDYTNFKKLIDSLSGVEVTIDERMHYIDKSGKLKIDFLPGKYLLDGEKALQYVRYRGIAGDIGRITRQQSFIKCFLRQLKNKNTVFRMYKLAKLLLREMNTNISLWDLLHLGLEIRHINIDNVRLSQLPGKLQKGYWITTPEAIVSALEVIFGPQKIDYVKPVTVEVFNGSHHRKAALEVTRRLRALGFDVLFYGDLDTKQKRTTVTDRCGNLIAAKQIAKILSTDEIFTRYTPSRLADMTVIIGEDYNSKSKTDTKCSTTQN